MPKLCSLKQIGPTFLEDLIAGLKDDCRDPPQSLEYRIDNNDDQVALGVELEHREDEQGQKDETQHVESHYHPLRDQVRFLRKIVLACSD